MKAATKEGLTLKEKARRFDELMRHAQIATKVRMHMALEASEKAAASPSCGMRQIYHDDVRRCLNEAEIHIEVLQRGGLASCICDSCRKYVHGQAPREQTFIVEKKVEVPA